MITIKKRIHEGRTYLLKEDVLGLIDEIFEGCVKYQQIEELKKRING